MVASLSGFAGTAVAIHGNTGNWPALRQSLTMVAVNLPVMLVLQ
jgi:hypothetical protein